MSGITGVALPCTSAPFLPRAETGRRVADWRRKKEEEGKSGGEDVGNLESEPKKRGRRGSRVNDPYLQIAAVLLSRPSGVDVDVDVPDANGYTPLHVASQRGCLGLVELFVDSGASLTTITSFDSKGRGGRTPAKMALFGSMTVTAEYLKGMEKRIEAGEEVATHGMAADLEGGYRLSSATGGNAVRMARAISPA